MNQLLTHHAVTHTAIGLLIQSITWLITGSPLLGAALAAGFYTGREIYQYFVQGKRHNGKFDWLGCVPVTIVVFAIALIVI